MGIDRTDRGTDELDNADSSRQRPGQLGCNSPADRPLEPGYPSGGENRYATTQTDEKRADAATDTTGSGGAEDAPTSSQGPHERRAQDAEAENKDTPVEDRYVSPLERMPSHGGFANLAEEFTARTRSREIAKQYNSADATVDRTDAPDRESARAPGDAAGQRSPERTDEPHEVTPPQIARYYYTNIPPTAQDRYLVRDQSNPVPVFDGSPTRDQVVQNDIGDCGIIATLGSVAEHRPNAIKNAITKVGDGQYEVNLHEVTEATSADPVARPTGGVKTYRVNDELPVRTDDPTRPLAGAGAETCGWPALMEKVIAAEDQTWDAAQKAEWDRAWISSGKPAVDQDRAMAGLGPSPYDAPMGYNRLDIGSTAYEQADLLAKLTGEAAEVRPIPGERHGERALLDGFRDQLDAGKPVIVGTRGVRSANEKFPDGVHAGHAYEVTKVENDKIHLRNPWGYDHPDPMETKTFWEYYRRYNHNGTRDGEYTTLK